MVYVTSRLLGLKLDSTDYDLVCGGTDGYIYENSGVLRAVNVNWNDDGWNVNANSVENSNDWNAGNRVFSRNYYFSSYLTDERFFVCKPFFHPPN